MGVGVKGNALGPQSLQRGAQNFHVLNLTCSSILIKVHSFQLMTSVIGHQMVLPHSQN